MYSGLVPSHRRSRSASVPSRLGINKDKVRAVVVAVVVSGRMRRGERPSLANHTSVDV